MLQLLKNGGVDEIVFRRIIPGKSGNIFEERQIGRRHFIEIAGEDGRFATSIFCDEPLNIHGANTLIRRRKIGERGQITHGTIAEVTEHHDLLPGCRLFQNPLGRDRFNFHKIRFTLWIESHSFRNPLFEGFMGRIPLFQPLAATVRDFHQRFLQKKTLARFHDVRTTPEEFGADRHDIER